MKILLDENLPRKLKIDFGFEHEVKTVRDMGWLGKKNGVLLKLISDSGFDFFITLDKNLQYQQNFKTFNFTVFILVAHNNRRETLQKLVFKIIEIIKSGKPEKLTIIS